MATLEDNLEPSEGFGWAEAFRNLVNDKLPTLSGLAGLPDETCDRIMRAPSLISQWLDGRAAMPKAVRALNYAPEDWAVVQSVCDELLASAFADDWQWLKSVKSVKVRRYFDPARRALFERGLTYWWDRPERVGAVIRQAEINPYPLLAALLYIERLHVQEAFAMCELVGRHKAPAPARLRGAVLAALVTRQRHGRFLHMIEGTERTLLTDAAEMLSAKPKERERIAAQLARDWKTILPINTTGKIGRVDQKFAEWPMALFLKTDVGKGTVFAMPMWVWSARAGSAKRLRDRTAMPVLSVPRAWDRIIRAQKIDGHPLDKEQVAAVHNALARPLSVITGGPGTGKTTIMRVIMEVAQRAGLTVAGFAPTGRAARRLEQQTGIPSATIHSALMLRGHTHSGLMAPCDLAVIDESSMLDTRTLHAVLTAAEDSAVRLVFLGDEDQLPAVDGSDVWPSMLKVLADYVPDSITRLVTRHRSTAITANARWLYGEGDQWVWDQTVQQVVLPPLEQGEALTPDWEAAITAWIQAHPGSRQIMAYRSRLTREVNALVRLAVQGQNPGDFLPGDRVVQRDNDYDRHNLRNGEQADIIEADRRYVTAVFDGLVDPVKATTRYAREHWEWAWAVTIHKAQGGEWDDVLIVAPVRDKHLLSRPALYTAITRVAKGAVTILSDNPDAVVEAARRHKGRKGGPAFSGYLAKVFQAGMTDAS